MKHHKAAPLLILSGVIFATLFILVAPALVSDSGGGYSPDRPVDLPKVALKEKKAALVFFGYSGCSDICTPRLEALDRLYESFDKEIKNEIEVLFVDITAPADETLPMRFASYFNPSFRGIYLTRSEIKEYSRAFEVYFSPKLFDKDEYDHSADLYLLARDKEGRTIIAHVYNGYPYNAKKIANDLKALLER